MSDATLTAIRLARKAHRIFDNFGGGYDCTCGERWDWTERKKAHDHADKAIADAVAVLVPAQENK